MDCAEKRIPRRAFSEREAFEVLLGQGVKIMCAGGCGYQITRWEDCERDHKIALATLPAEKRRDFDAPFNCRYICIPCHRLKTFGTRATTAGSDIHAIAKSRRLRNPKPKGPSEIRSRPFQKSPERLAKLARRDYVRNGGES